MYEISHLQRVITDEITECDIDAARFLLVQRKKERERKKGERNHE
jgi:hypothetical protein